jgi:hypothetical protein
MPIRDGDEVRELAMGLAARFGGPKAPKVNAQGQPIDPRLPPKLTPSMKRQLVDEKRQRDGLPVTPLFDRLLSYGVPAALAKSAMEGDPEAPGMKLAEQLARGEGKILMLAGMAGRGKSTAAAYALTFKSGLWVFAPHLSLLFGQHKDAVDDSAMNHAGLLVIDDLGSEHSPGGHVAGRVNAVLVIREAHGLPTALTTNLPAEKFKTIYGDRIVSRLNAKKESLGWQVLDGPDLRSVESAADPQPSRPSRGRR